MLPIVLLETKISTVVSKLQVSSTEALTCYQRNICMLISGHQYVKCGSSRKKTADRISR